MNDNEILKVINNQNDDAIKWLKKLKNIDNDHSNAIKLQETKYKLALQEEKAKSVQEIEKLTTLMFCFMEIMVIMGQVK